MVNDLVLILGAQFMIYATAWLLMVMLSSRDRIAPLLWCFYNLLQGLSFFSTPYATTPLSAQLLLLCSVLGYAFANIGADYFLHHRVRYFNLWLGLVVGGLLIFSMLGLYGGPRLALLVTLNGTAIAFAFAALWLFWRPLYKEFGMPGLFTLLPSAIYGALLLIRTVHALINPMVLETIGDPSRPRVGLYLFVLGIVGMVNLGFFGLLTARYVARIHRHASTDTLTGALNRKGIRDALSGEWNRFKRSKRDFSLVFIDIDHFKQINDSGGHEAGDRVLAAVVTCIQTSIRHTDSLGRWGGDELLLLLPEASAEDAQHLLERVHLLLRRQPVPQGCMPLTISAGIAESRNSASAEDMIQHADAAMYRAKAESHDLLRQMPQTAS